ncbi:hypothetical protein [Nocardioides soli]|uniref:Uncharacterized protein n=1 Tax=Nocardioides soli TaxID=1036020 RepID=A0A7W4W1R0_9ACTN|nr:hypothetical protein [Nocardioides soli]MBB3045690.1 hypothetical protein [Nocardioides soli]
MTARTRSRTFLVGAAAAALAAPLAAVVSLAGPAQASGNRPHELTMYKVEQFVTLEGEYPDNTARVDLRCNPGDHVVDGMWKIDAVDDVNPSAGIDYGDERDVVFTSSYSLDSRTWRFQMENRADGRAQVKLFVTCLGGRTQKQYGHRHRVRVSNPVKKTVDWTANGLRMSSNQARMGYGNSATEHSYFGTEWGSAASYATPGGWSMTCASGEVAVAPGYDFTHGSGRLFINWPSANSRGWLWGFVVNDAATVDVSFRCLRVKTDRGGPHPRHVHKVSASWWPNGHQGSLRHLPASPAWEEQQSCDSQAKALVGAFWIQHPEYSWYLGMDPRIKTRAYKFWHTAGPDVAWVSTLCVGDRTGKQLRP